MSSVNFRYLIIATNEIVIAVRKTTIQRQNTIVLCYEYAIWECVFVLRQTVSNKRILV